MPYQLFPYRHDWAFPVVERLSWLTDVARAKNGSERRRAIRSYPRHSLDLVLAVGEGSRQALQYDLLNYRGDWLVPQWQHLAPAKTTPRGLEPNGYVVFFSADYESYAEVQLSVLVMPTAPLWAAFVVPAGIARIDSGVQMLNHDGNQASVRLTASFKGYREEVAGYTGSTDGQGKPVLTLKPERSGPVEATFTLDANRVDYGKGWTDDLRADKTFHAWQHSFVLHQPAHHTYARQFLWAVRGRSSTFIANTDNQDQSGMSEIAVPLTFAARLESDTVELSWVTGSMAELKMISRALP